MSISEDKSRRIFHTYYELYEKNQITIEEISTRTKLKEYTIYKIFYNNLVMQRGKGKLFRDELVDFETSMNLRSRKFAIPLTDLAVIDSVYKLYKDGGIKLNGIAKTVFNSQDRSHLIGRYYKEHGDDIIRDQRVLKSIREVEYNYDPQPEVKTIADWKSMSIEERKEYD